MTRGTPPARRKKRDRPASAAEGAAAAQGTPESAAAVPPAADTASLPELTRDELRRYRRHVVLPGVGREGQRRLKAGSVLVVGAGGLGSPAALYLAAAGVGRLGLCDFDVVDETNLQRQILHGTRDVGRSKLASARDRLADLNPHVELAIHETRLGRHNAFRIFGAYDVIVDGTDNFATRYLVADACALLGKPNVYGSIFRFEGQASVFWPPRGPCYRCLFPEPPPAGLAPSCAEGGVLGVLPGVVGSIQALEAIKLIVGAGKSLVGRLVLFDALSLRFRELVLRRDPGCPLCGERPTIRALQDYDHVCGLVPLEDGGRPISAISAPELHQWLEAGGGPVVLDVREPHELSDDLGFIRQSYLIPLHALPERVDELWSVRERDIVVVCSSGWRSAMAVRFLHERGFGRVANLAGGMVDWTEEGFPVEIAAPDGKSRLLVRRELADAGSTGG